MRRTLAVLASLLIVGGCTEYRLHLNLDGPSAISLAGRSDKVAALLRGEFRRPFLKKTSCSLRWIREPKSYEWIVEYVDAACGCGGNPPRVEVRIDPNSARVKSVKLFKREQGQSCTNECHAGRLPPNR